MHVNEAQGKADPISDDTNQKNGWLPGEGRDALGTDMRESFGEGVEQSGVDLG